MNGIVPKTAKTSTVKIVAANQRPRHQALADANQTHPIRTVVIAVASGHNAKGNDMYSSPETTAQIV